MRSVELPSPYKIFPGSGGDTFLWLPLPQEQFFALPETTTINEIVLTRRPEFHVTLGCLTTVLRAAGAPEEQEQEMLNIFSAFVEHSPIRFQDFIPDIRFVAKGERRSLVIRCTVSNLEGLYQAWEQHLRSPIPRQPTHVTLYALAPHPGIGIDTPEEMDALSRVDVPEIEKSLIVVP